MTAREGDVLQKVLERAFSDQQFRVRLEADLDEALGCEGYKLSSDERRQLKGILDEGRESFATGLDQRLSQSGVSLSPQGLLRAKSKTANKQEGMLHLAVSGKGPKYLARTVPEPEKAAPGKRLQENNRLEPVDKQEPDYEVETD